MNRSNVANTALSGLYNVSFSLAYESRKLERAIVKNDLGAPVQVPECLEPLVLNRFSFCEDLEHFIGT